MGGVEQVIYQLSEGGFKYDIQSDVLSLSPQGASSNVPLGKHVTHTARLDLQLASTGFSFSCLRVFQALAQQTDVIHYHFPWPFMDLVHFASRTTKPYIVTYHSDIVKQRLLRRLYRPLMERFLDRADRIVATSPNYVASSAILQQYTEKTVVIPIGLEKATYPDSTLTKLEYWKRLVGDHFFLFVGALRYYKGLTFLLEAAVAAPFPIVIVGSGPEEQALKAQANRLRLANVRFVGAVPDDDKAALLELCTCLIFPSHLRSEAFGISLLEGAMYGKPMISCEIGTGTSYINLHHQTGFIVPPENPQALSAAMNEIWRSPDVARQMGRRARQRYNELFTGDQMICSYAALYREVATRAG